MALDPAAIQELIKKLDQDRAQYFTTLAQFHDSLTKALSAYNQAPIVSPVPESLPSLRTEELRSFQQPFSGIATRTGPPSSGDVKSSKKPSLLSADPDDSSESESGESYFVQDTLPVEFHSQDDLKTHLDEYMWTPHGVCVLHDLLQQKHHHKDKRLFEDLNSGDIDVIDDNNTAAVYVVGEDGAPLLANRGQGRNGLKPVWDALQSINADEDRKQAVGRISILREPPALLFAAAHLTMKNHFDMDFIFKILTDESPSKAYMKGCLKSDPRHHRSFIFCFKYHTIVGYQRAPMPWQSSDKDLTRTADHLPISTCSSVVALTLSGDSYQRLERKSRKTKQIIGHIYDPFAPWQVLSIQCYPDWHASTDVVEGNRNYVNGPEAFLITVLHEYRDASRRFMELNKAIVKMVTPSSNFLFDSDLREQLLFENKNYSYSKRYFWAHQAIALLNDEIEALINQYRDKFTDEVWNGEHKYLWPGTKDKSARYQFWRKRMTNLKKQFEKEIENLEHVLAANKQEQKDINSLREQLFSGTSVLESREAVKLADITVQQGQNIRLLTLVSIFFLPLTYATSVFGMTNMPQNTGFLHFGIVTLVVCLPTYVLIALVEGKSTQRLDAFWKWLQQRRIFQSLKRKRIERDSEKGLGGAVMMRPTPRPVTDFQENSMFDGDHVHEFSPRPPKRTSTAEMFVQSVSTDRRKTKLKSERVPPGNTFGIAEKPLVSELTISEEESRGETASKKDANLAFSPPRRSFTFPGIFAGSRTDRGDESPGQAATKVTTS